MTEKTTHTKNEKEKMEKTETSAESKTEEKIIEKKEIKADEKGKKEKVKVEKIKKSEATVYARDIPISTLDARAICKFIKKKTIQKAVGDLKEVLVFRKAVPMKGEIPHRKGKMMSGRYPKKACEYFLKILKSLQGNANANNMDEPIITEAFADMASRPYGQFGRVRRKRTHIKIKVTEKKVIRKGKK